MFCLAAINMSFAQTNAKASADDIKDAIEQVNGQYNMNFKYVGNDNVNISKEECIAELAEIAQREKELLQYIEFRKNNPRPQLSNKLSVSLMSTNWVTKTQTKNTAHPMLRIRCTFQERYNTVRQVNHLSSSTLCTRSRYWFTSTSKRVYKLDSGRTLAIKDTGIISTGYATENATAYAEF